MVGVNDTKTGSNVGIDQDFVLKCYRYYVEREKEKEKEVEREVLEEISEFSRYDFRSVDFSKKIKASYLECSYLVNSQQETMTKLTTKITAMAQFDRYLLLGTING